MKQSHSKLKKYAQKGMSLVEVLVAMGIAGVVSLGVMRINENMIKGQRTMEQKSNKMDFQNKIARLMANQNVCDATLYNLIVPATGSGETVLRNGTVVPSINTWSDPAANPRVPIVLHSATRGQTGNNIGTGSAGNLYIREMRVGGFKASSSPFFTDDPDTPAVLFNEVEAVRGTATFIISYNKPEDESGSSKSNTNLSYGTVLTTAVQLDVVIRRDNNRVISCMSDTNQHIAAMCANLGGVIDSADGICKQINIDRLNPATNPAGNLDFSITALNGIHAVNGVFIGDVNLNSTGANIFSQFAGATAGNHGLGVDTPIPGRGSIAAEKDITSNSGNIHAKGGEDPFTGVPTGGQVIAENNITSNKGDILASEGDVVANNNVTATLGNVTAGTNVFAGANMHANGSISANGHISAMYTITAGGNIQTAATLIGQQAQFLNCKGGTVVTNSSGKTFCVLGTVSNCENKVDASKRYTYIYAFAGYNEKGEAECKEIMRFDNANCPNNQYMYGYDLGKDGKMVPRCAKPGEGCSDKKTVHRKWVAGKDPFGINGPATAKWVMEELPATRTNVCANGYLAPLDNNGFRCPGDKQNIELVDQQPIVYGCESANNNDVVKTQKFFTTWTCGDPTAPANTLGVFVDESKTKQVDCRLGAKKEFRSYKECYAAGGQVRFYPATSGTVKTSKVTVGYGSRIGGSDEDVKVEESIAVPVTAALTGREEDSYCLLPLPPEDAEKTSGRSPSYATNKKSCLESSCGHMWGKELDDAAMDKYRVCPSVKVKVDGKTVTAKFKLSEDPEKYYYYEVAPTTCNSFNLTEEGSDCANNIKITNPKVTGGFFATKSSKGSEWKGTRVGTLLTDWNSRHLADTDHVNSLPKDQISGWDTGIWKDGSGNSCDTTSSFHRSPYVCYGKITGIACR